VVEGHVELDESLLSGESELVSRAEGQELHSGSFCVAGAGLYRAERIGHASFANSLAVSARRFRRVLTPLQCEVNVILRVILLVALMFEIILLAEGPISHLSIVESVKMSVVIAKLVPAGLFLSITLAYALGALRIARQGALVQEINAVESLSNVDVLCLDKTGTLTANRLELHAILPIGIDEAALRDALGTFAASMSAGNRTTEGLAASIEGKSSPVADEVSFSSERKWSGLDLSDPVSARNVYVLGAIEALKSTTVLPE